MTVYGKEADTIIDALRNRVRTFKEERNTNTLKHASDIQDCAEIIMEQIVEIKTLRERAKNAEKELEQIITG